MSEKRLALISEDELEEKLKDQIEIYHGIKNQSIWILRLVVATGAVAIAFLSAVMSGFLETDIEIREITYYLNQTVQNTPNGEFETSFTALILMIVSMLVLFGAFMASLSGISNIVSVITQSGIYPYLTRGNGERIDFVLSKTGENTEALRSMIAMNNIILSRMDETLSNAYRNLGASVTLLILGLMLFGISYFSEIRLAKLLAGIVIVSGSIYGLTKGLIVLFGYNSEKAKRRIDWIDEQSDKLRTSIITVLFTAVMIIPMGLILYILEGRLFLIGLLLAILGLTLIIHLPLIHAEYTD